MLPPIKQLIFFSLFISLSFLFLTSEMISWLSLNVQLHGFFSSSETIALYIKFKLLFPHASLSIFTFSNIDFLPF